MTFILEKMQSQVGHSTEYFLAGMPKKPLNDLLGKTIAIEHTGNYSCIQCNRAIKKTFQQGYCFPCLRRLQECNLCIIHPERCRVMEGCCPIDDWAHKQCHANHVIYLSYTSGLKVGITQHKNMPSRWVDQGAVAASAFMSTTNRFLCGQVEMALKAHVGDKTNWRTMLKESPEAPDLIAEWDRIMAEAKPALLDLIDEYGEENISFIEKPVVQHIRYPVNQYPEKIVSLSLDKTPTVTGKLLGIKGQYLYFDNGVMNVRKFGGYEVNLIAV
jgi:hypothetical protein